MFYEQPSEVRTYILGWGMYLEIRAVLPQLHPHHPFQISNQKFAALITTPYHSLPTFYAFLD